MRTTGRWVTVTAAERPHKAFLPNPLPPAPPLALTPEDQDLLERANRALGRLDGAADLLPDPTFLTYAYVRKEALVSSQIEGTQSSLSDLLLFEDEQVPGVPLEDVREVSDYIAALEHGMARLRGGFPLSGRLIREIHAILLRTGRGSIKNPGEFRRGPVWLGGPSPDRAVFVPPPWQEVPDALAALERFLHDEGLFTPTLLKAGLAHAQFETIHPFNDGNGRIGRLLITLILCAEKALAEPILYLSLYLKYRRTEYYDRLQNIRTKGDWESWIRFFLQGVLETSENALETTRRILALFEADRARIQALGKAASSAFAVYERLRQRPIVRLNELARSLGHSFPTISAAMARLESLGIAQELTGYSRNRVFAYTPYIKILAEGTEPLP